jgi:hypothetical protein
MINKNKTVVFVILSLALTILSIGVIANANNINNKENIAQPSFFDAEITFYIFTGEGCACTPIQGVSVSAYGGAGNESGVTDIDGKCVLTLEINSEYDIYIQGEGLQEIYFEMNIIDDQTFTFHLFERKGVSRTANLFNIQILKNIFQLLQQ